ncbi:transcription factor CP2-like protein 1 [Menidia menidia]
MLFCHPQPETYHQTSATYISSTLWQSTFSLSTLSPREALAPFLKNEEARLMADNGAKRSPFQYILCAATSPAVKQQDETLTYLNQGQSYEIRMLNRKLVEYTDISSKYVKVGVRYCSYFLVCGRSLKPPFHFGGGVSASDSLSELSSGGTSAPRGPDALSVTTPSSSAPSPVYSSPTPCAFSEGNCSPNLQGELFMPGCSDHLLPASSPQDTQQWLLRHRFSPFSRLFSSFSGADLLRMSREDLIQICGPADGIRLFNTMKGRCIQPRLTIYVCQQQSRNQPPIKQGGADIYHALYLEELTLGDLSEKIALLYSVTPQKITHIYRQKPTGIHVLVSDEMVQNFREEASFLISTVRDENTDGFHVVLK